MTKTGLIQLRESRGLTRYRVAKDLDVAYDALARIEDGDRPKIDRELLRQLAEYYGSDLTLEHVLSCPDK